MKLDRNTNSDGRGKYALILLRKTSHSIPTLCKICHKNKIALDLGMKGTKREFFVIRLRDKYAPAALEAYAKAAAVDDPEWADEILTLLRRRSIILRRRAFVGTHRPD